MYGKRKNFSNQKSNLPLKNENGFENSEPFSFMGTERAKSFAKRKKNGISV
jgi:hypothetical protein